MPDRIRNLDKAEPRPRFKNEEEREAHRIGISRRRHARTINENYGPTSLYSTLTLDNESEVHTFRRLAVSETSTSAASSITRRTPGSIFTWAGVNTPSGYTFI